MFQVGIRIVESGLVDSTDSCSGCFLSRELSIKCHTGTIYKRKRIQ